MFLLKQVLYKFLYKQSYYIIFSYIFDLLSGEERKFGLVEIPARFSSFIFVSRKRTGNDFAPSIRNSFATVRQGIDRFPEHDGVIPPRPCGLFRSPQPFLSFPRLSHVPLPCQHCRNLLLRPLSSLFFFFQFFFSSSLHSSFLLFFSLYHLVS